LNLSLDFDSRELVDQATYSTAGSRKAKKLTHTGRIQIKVAAPRHIDFLGLMNNIPRTRGELSKR